MGTDEKRPNQEVGSFETKFDFNEWSDLYQKNPQLFENKREEFFKDIINSAPREFQNRLNGIMFQVKITRDKAKTPLQSCIAISNMMQNTFSDLCYFLSDLNYTLNGGPDLSESQAVSKLETATILNFGR